MSRILLLTGATGFVGRQVLNALSKLRLSVRVVVRNGSQDSLPIVDGIESIITTEDMFAEDAEWWARVCFNIDTVIHTAWYTEPGKYLHAACNLDCLSGTLLLAKAAAQVGVRRFVGVGTCFEYDLSFGTLSVETPLGPSTPYAASKAAAFVALSQWLPSQGVEFAWCRLFYLYGEGEDIRRLAPYIRSKLEQGEYAELTNGNQMRDFLDVCEAGRSIAEEAIGHQQGAINICSGVPLTVRQFAEGIANEYGRADLLKFGARSENLIDPPYVVGIK